MARRLALAALALCGVLGALWWLGRQEKGELRQARRESQLAAFDDRRVTAFTLEEGGARTRFERTGGSWRITQPAADPASDVAIDGLFGALRRAVVIRTLPEAGPLEQYGLNPPRRALRFEGGEPLEVDLGDVDPTGAGVFVRVSTRTGVQLAKLPEAAPLAELRTSRLRDPRLLTVPRSQVGAISVVREGRELRLVRRPSGWWISAPREFPASDGAVDKMLEILVASEATEIDDAARPSDSRLGLAGPGATEIRLSVGESVRRLVLGPTGTDGVAWATRDDRGAPMRFADAKFDRVPATFDQLRETRLSKVNRYAVLGVRWSAPEGELAAAREGATTWKSPAGELLRGAGIVEFLAASLDAPVEGWDEAPFVGRPEATLEVEADAGVRERIEFFADRTARVGSVPGVRFRLKGARPAYRP